VRLVNQAATRARCVRRGFEVVTARGLRLRAKKLLLATGVLDELPPIVGVERFYGRSVFHCPYCDGWESRDRPIAVYSRTANGASLAIALLVWSADVVLCTDGMTLAPAHIRRLQARRISWRGERIARLEGDKGQLKRIVFATGDVLDRSVMFFNMGQRQASNLAEQLGCGFTSKGAVRTGEYEASDIPGLYVAGDASRMVQLAIVAAAEGAQAAFAINTDLIKEDDGRPGF
jgi:thioredoxin reductase